jgi:murein DD-endopeptidase MepM/ murein hydrolase activator NlpD
LNAKSKISLISALVILLLVVIVPVAWFAAKRMEGTPPTIDIQMDSPMLGASQTLTISAADEQSGLRQVRLVLVKDGKETPFLEKEFPAGSFWSGGSARRESLTVSLDIRAKGLSDGKGVLQLSARDCSWRKWSHGNRAYREQEVTIDTRIPEIDVLSKSHNVNRGGVGLVVYRLSEPCRQSGMQVGDQFYPGYNGHFKDPNIHLAFFALNHLQDNKTILQITAVDLAGNQNRRGFNYLLKDKKFKSDTIVLTDKMINSLMAEFRPQIPDSASKSPLEIFLAVNRDMRQANYETFKKLTNQSEKKLLWQGDFIRLPNAAPRAGFADHRKYMYNNQQIDEQTHLGADLASLEQSPVPAANAGKVVFGEYLGIYGRSVLIDHGFGLFSLYSHLSQIAVTPGQVVGKGDIIGKTGQTGLAGGDHLHFSVLVSGVFVNPVEWWDTHWIQDNILSKFEGLQ